MTLFLSARYLRPMYRDLAAALERVDRLEAENAELRAVRRTPISRLNVVAFVLFVASGAALILIGSWLVNS